MTERYVRREILSNPRDRNLILAEVRDRDRNLLLAEVRDYTISGPRNPADRFSSPKWTVTALFRGCEKLLSSSGSSRSFHLGRLRNSRLQAMMLGRNAQHDERYTGTSSALP